MSRNYMNHALKGLRKSKAILPLALLAALTPSGTTASAQRRIQFAPPVHAAVADEILVGVTPDADTADAVASLSQPGGSTNDAPAFLRGVGRVLHHFTQQHAYRLKVAPGTNLQATLTRLQKTPGIAYAELNNKLSMADISLPNDPGINNGQGAQWGPIRTSAYLAWNLWKPKNVQPIVIAIVDTGVDSTHPDLANMMYRDAGGNILGYDATKHLPGPALPGNPHGTHVAGIAAAQTNNGQGISGMAGWTGDTGTSDTWHVKVMPVRVLDDNGNGSSADVAEGITWAADHGAKVINLSLGGPDTNYTLYQAILYANTKGCVICAAAGNYGLNTKFYPAYYKPTIAVAGSMNNTLDTLASWSDYGSWVSVAAPGDTIYSTWPGGGYAYDSGTSMASPHVAGLAALIWAQNPTLKNTDVSNFILNTVDKYPSTADPIAKNGGRINASSAITAVNAAMPGISAAVTFQDSTSMAQPLTVEFRSTDGTLNFSYVLTPDSDGHLALPGVPSGNYKIAFRSPKWLQRTVAALVSPALPTTLFITLAGGDANGDNVVDLSDFSIVVNAYNDTLNYEAEADFNNDGIVDLTDMGILINSYGQHGDP